ncbi:MAG: UDP-N-acetylmuramoyl-L-alanyl-D-glutamate--2,6-diaminopimelate ligase [Spirochaetes bacterium]|nr:UDP-N-acetylmuramoyl-L-alanyl-D-glutamate--2,6-diaminopimelate ligase [Spirochaetota bacterium]
MKTRDILNQTLMSYEIISDNSQNDINNVVLNDKLSNSNTIFTAIKGFKADGHSFIINSFLNGCRDFILEKTEGINQGIFKEILSKSTVIKVYDSRAALAEISNAIFGFPSDKIKMIGITGTKGKTTVSTLLHKFLTTEHKTSLFTTIKNIIGSNEVYANRTTMEANELHFLLHRSLECQERAAVVEVSSHGVTLKRVHGINWDAAVFTSFSRDHLDLYKTMEKYFEAKLALFNSLNGSIKKNKMAVINTDDKKGIEICSILNKDVKIIKVGSKKDNDYRINNIKNDYNGIEFELINYDNTYKIKSKMRGLFNVTNIALASACAVEMGIDIKNINKVLSNYSGVEGRFEIIADKPFIAIVDYAHSPDSLQKILDEAKNLTKKRVICVFGCPGERDREKREIMGKIASKLADFSIITNDDTYNEDPLTIAKEIEKGFLKNKKIINKDYKIILDRKDAIYEALKKAKNNDVIIAAGMGHQKVQILNTGTVCYNDKKTILSLMKKINKI